MNDPTVDPDAALEDFLETNHVNDPRVVDVEMDGDTLEWVVFKSGTTAVVISVRSLGAFGNSGSHLSVDAHAFRDGLPARLGVFLMEDGRRYELADKPETPGTSHGWPAARGATLLVGDQR